MKRLMKLICAALLTAPVYGSTITNTGSASMGCSWNGAQAPSPPDPMWYTATANGANFDLRCQVNYMGGFVSGGAGHLATWARLSDLAHIPLGVHYSLSSAFDESLTLPGEGWVNVAFTLTYTWQSGTDMAGAMLVGSFLFNGAQEWIRNDLTCSIPLERVCPAHQIVVTLEERVMRGVPFSYGGLVSQVGQGGNMLDANNSLTISVAEVPEPSAWLLVSAGLLGSIFLRLPRTLWPHR